PGKIIENLELDSFRTTFAKQNCCTTNSDGSRDGDPLNLVIVEGRRDPIVPFVARDWHLARQLNVASAIDTARAFIFQNEFLTSLLSRWTYLVARKMSSCIRRDRQ